MLDAFAGRAVGWSIVPSKNANFVFSSLGMTNENRQAEGVMIHSYHRTNYMSWAFTRRAVDSGLVPLMESIGDCEDNGQMEWFWAQMQVELVSRKRWDTRLESANTVFE